MRSSSIGSCSPSVNSVAKKMVIFSSRSEEHTSELQSRSDLVCRLLLEKKKKSNHEPRGQFLVALQESDDLGIDAGAPDALRLSLDSSCTLGTPPVDATSVLSVLNVILP